MMADLPTRYGRSRLWVLLLLIVIGQAGCGSPRRGEPLAGPLRTDDPQVERGRLVFARNCHLCHPGGEGGLGPALNDKPLPGFLLRTQIRLGLGAMPAFNEQQISHDQLDDLVKFMMALRKHEDAPNAR